MGCCSRTPEELATVLTAARQKVPRADGEYKGPAGQFEGLGFGMIRRTGFFKKRGAAGQRFQDPEFLQTLRSILEQVRHVKRRVYFFFFNRKSNEKALSPNAQCCKNVAINEILPELADYLDRPTMRGRGRSPLSRPWTFTQPSQRRTAVSMTSLKHHVTQSFPMALGPSFVPLELSRF